MALRNPQLLEGTCVLIVAMIVAGNLQPEWDAAYARGGAQVSAPKNGARTWGTLADLKRPLQRELEHAGRVERVDDLKLSEALLRYQVTLLIWGGSVAAVRPEGAVLEVAHAVAVLDVIVRVIHHVKGLRLQGHGVALRHFESAREPEIDLLDPGAIEGIQSRKRTRAAGVNAESGVCGGLQGGRIIDRIRQGAYINQRGIGTPGGELHHRAERPVGERFAPKAVAQSGSEVGRVDGRDREAMALIE